MMNPTHGKGDKRRPSTANVEQFDSEMDRLFPKDKRQSGRFKMDEATGKFISTHEWNKKYYVPKVKTHYIQGDIEPYTSPVDGKVIHSRKDNREDLLRNDCRQWEGTQQETMVAEQYKSDKDKKFENSIGDMIAETAAGIKEGRVETDRSGKVDFTFGMD